MLHSSFRSLTLLALLPLATPLGCGSTDTDSNGDVKSGKCVHQPGAVSGLDWSLVCGGPIDEYFPSVAALDDSVLLGFQLGNAGEPPGAAGLDLGGGAEINSGAGDILVGAFDDKGSYRWSQQWGDTNQQSVQGLANLGGGRFALHGLFCESLAFGEVSLPAPKDADDCPTFLAVLEGKGEHFSHRVFTVGAPDAFVSIRGITGGPGGEIAIAGQFRETVDLGGGEVIAKGLYDGFVAVYEADGALRFARVLGGTGGDQFGNAAAFAEGGALAVAGQYDGTLDVGDGAPLTGSGPFLVALSASGEVLSKLGATGDQSPQYGTAVAKAPDGDTILGGEFLGTINLGGEDLVNLDQEQIEETNYDLFVARFDPQGAHRWSVRLGDTQNDDLLGVHVDSKGRTLAVWGGETSGLRVTAIDAAGSVTELFVSTVRTAQSVSFAADGSIYVAGYSEAAVDFGAGAVDNAGGNDVWLARLLP